MLKNLNEKKKNDHDQETLSSVTTCGWFMPFKNKYVMHNITVQGEAASAHEKAAAECIKTLWKIIRKRITVSKTSL